MVDRACWLLVGAYMLKVPTLQTWCSMSVQMHCHNANVQHVNAQQSRSAEPLL